MANQHFNHVACHAALSVGIARTAPTETGCDLDERAPRLASETGGRRPRCALQRPAGLAGGSRPSAVSAASSSKDRAWPRSASRSKQRRIEADADGEICLREAGQDRQREQPAPRPGDVDTERRGDRRQRRDGQRRDSRSIRPP